MTVDTFYALFLGITIGVFHAFDADHVVAMATFVNQKSKKRQVLKYALKWGGGHGGTLLVLGSLLVFIGIELPNWFVHYSEMMVGVLLVYLGFRLWSYLNNKKSSYKLKNQHPQKTKLIDHEHAPLFIGMLHGVAGSAPILALLPNMIESKFLIHILMFSSGCLIGMFLFGMGLGFFQTSVKKLNGDVAHNFGKLLSVFSVGLGTFWLFN